MWDAPPRVWAPLTGSALVCLAPCVSVLDLCLYVNVLGKEELSQHRPLKKDSARIVQTTPDTAARLDGMSCRTWWWSQTSWKSLHRNYKVKMCETNTLTKLMKEKCGSRACIKPNRPSGYKLETQISYRGTLESIRQHRSEASSQHKGLFCFDWLIVQIWLSLKDVIRTKSKTRISRNALVHSDNDPALLDPICQTFGLKSATEDWAQPSKLVLDKGKTLSSSGSQWGARSRVLLPSQEVRKTKTQRAG